MVGRGGSRVEPAVVGQVDDQRGFGALDRIAERGLVAEQEDEVACRFGRPRMAARSDRVRGDQPAERGAQPDREPAGLAFGEREEPALVVHCPRPRARSEAVDGHETLAARLPITAC